MEEIKLQYLNTILLYLLTLFLAVFAISGCSEGPYQLGSKITAPAIAPAVEIWKPYNFAMVWRRPIASDETRADIYMFLAPDTIDTTRISEASVDTGTLELVFLGKDRYFLAWIDRSNDGGSLLRWQIRKRTNRIDPEEESSPLWIVEKEGGYEPPVGNSVVEIAAAYQPNVTVAEYFQTETSPATMGEKVLLPFLLRDADTFGPCSFIRGEPKCKLLALVVDVREGEEFGFQREVEGASSGPTRGLSIAAGGGGDDGRDGFLVTYANSLMTSPDGVNTVIAESYTADGVSRGATNFISITGKTDCADELEVIENDNVSVAGSVSVNGTQKNFIDTSVAYDSENERYLVGYITNCNSHYFRARLVHEIKSERQSDEGAVVLESSGKWVVSGVDPNAFPYATNPEGDVIEPPFQIGRSAHAPMLAYDANFDSSGSVFIAAYATSAPINHEIERDMLYAQFLKYDGRILGTEPIRVMDEDTTEFDAYGNLYYKNFKSGDLVDHPGENRFYITWSETRYIVPCERNADGDCEDTDWDSKSISLPSGYYDWYESVPSR